MKKSNRQKQKVVEVFSVHSLLRTPNRSRHDNSWIAEVAVEVRGPVYAHPPRIVRRVVNVTARDELDVFKKLITEGV